MKIYTPPGSLPQVSKDLLESLMEGSSFTFNSEGREDSVILKIARLLANNSTLTDLKLDRNGISDVGAEYLAIALRSNTTLTSLSLSVNQITDVGAKHLAEALEENSTLTQLDLSYNKISESGKQPLIELSQSSSTLTTIDLSFNRYTYMMTFDRIPLPLPLALNPSDENLERKEECLEKPVKLASEKIDELHAQNETLSPEN